MLASLLCITAAAGCKDKEPVPTDNNPTKQESGVKLIPSLYEDGLEYCVASYDVVKDFKADNTGKKDATDAINQALFKAQMDGGGTVYLPEGRYLVKDVIYVPTNVVLRGEWQSPETAPAGSGTVLLADNDSIFTVDPVLFLQESGGVQNITVLYPNQSTENPVKYYYTVEIGHYRCFTMENLTVLGAWDGIALGSERQGNEIFYLKNVYVSALNLGIYNTNTTDVGRMEGVHISPKYWLENTVSPLDEAEQAAAREYFRKNARGIEFYLNDWGMAYDVTLSDLSVGLYFGISASRNRGMDGKFMNVRIENCDTGIYIDGVKLDGVGFTNLDINTDWESTAAIDSSDKYSGTCMFYNTNISGGFKYPVRNNGLSGGSTAGSYAFVKGEMSGWSEGSYGVTLNGGSVTMQKVNFAEAKGHLKASDKIQSVSLLGCTFGGSADISIPASMRANCDIDHTPVTLPDTETAEYKFIEKTPRPASTKLVDVRDFGADTKNPDNTEAVNKALKSLEKTGGTVYIPAGNWQFKGVLNVPSGVELRGCCPVQQMQNKEGITGTILWVYSGKGDENAAPFITLEAGSGALGFCTFYPEQNKDEGTVAYPWTVRATGEDCWAVSVTLTNSYNGLDFGTHRSNGFYIDFIGGSPVRRGVFVGNNDGEGWLQNCQFNPNYAYVLGYNSGSKNDRLYYCDAFILGYVEKLHCLSMFEYGSKTGMLVVSEEGKAANGSLINLGVDGTETSLRILKGGKLEFINPQLVAMESINQKTNILIEDSFKGTANIFNGTIWGPTNTLLHIKGGNININMLNIATGYGDYSLLSEGGKTAMNSVIFHNLKHKIGKGTEKLSVFGSYTRSYQRRLELVNEGSGGFEQKHGWWS